MACSCLRLFDLKLLASFYDAWMACILEIFYQKLDVFDSSSGQKSFRFERCILLADPAMVASSVNSKHKTQSSRMLHSIGPSTGPMRNTTFVRRVNV